MNDICSLPRQAALKKTMRYAALGYKGWMAAMVKGVLYNWMVTLGVVLAFASRSTLGKVVAMWLPMMTFFARGYEHSVVNMFLIPAGMFFHAPVSVGQWWWWNQLPVTIGNIVSRASLPALFSTLPMARLHSGARNRCFSNRSLLWAWRLREHERERWAESSLPDSYPRVLH